MRRTLAALLLLVFVTPARAEAPAKKLISEAWDAAYLDGIKAGHFQTTVNEVAVNDQPIRLTTRTMNMTVKRFGQLNQILAEECTAETADGKVVGLAMRVKLGGDQAAVVKGQVQDGQLKITRDDPNIPGGRLERTFPWDDTIIGLGREASLIADRKPRVGDKLSYRMFMPVVTNIVRVDVTVGDWEEVSLNGASRKLLRVETRPQEIQGVQLPMQIIWYGPDLRPVKTQTQMPGLGELTLVRTTKADAMKPVGELRDMANLQEIVLKRLIPQPHQQDAVTYRVTFPPPPPGQKRDYALNQMFPAGDGRQFVKVVGPDTVELRITAVRRPGADEAAPPPGKEYTASNFFINSADGEVRRHAAAAVGVEADPWRKAQLIERWVRTNMRVLNFSEAMATADRVARTLEGDCTEYAMLAAAMCRAEGIPSRTAIGLVYHVDRGVPKLNYHMWTEVWVRGQWVALDATLGLGSVGPAHLKITDHHWHDTQSMVPMLPVMRVMMNKPTIEVVKVGP